MRPSRLFLSITGILELVLGIPIIGGLIVIGFSYTPLTVMLILHILTLVLCVRDRSDIHGSIVGIVTSFLAYIPVIGWIMHLTTAVLLLFSALRNKRRIA